MDGRHLLAIPLDTRGFCRLGIRGDEHAGNIGGAVSATVVTYAVKSLAERAAVTGAVPDRRLVVS